VAFLEEHSRALPGWLAETLRAFRGPWAAVGPRVISANPNMGFTNAMGKINYGEWSAAQAAREAKMLPGNNSAYRRQALIDLGDQLPDLLMTDTVLQARLMALGGRLFLAPSAVVAHRYPVTLWSAAKGEYLYHIGFAGVRAAVFEWSWVRRLGYAAASVVIPWLRLGRLVRGGSLRLADGRLFLGTVFLLHAAVLGQAVGVVAGTRHAALRFTDYELNEPRPATEDPPRER
jgi:cellulose synthase/poly-beta-1,6-N-acetylglucosamine synthase-like glycosyltransferase